MAVAHPVLVFFLPCTEEAWQQHEEQKAADEPTNGDDSEEEDSDSDDEEVCGALAARGWLAVLLRRSARTVLFFTAGLLAASPEPCSRSPCSALSKVKKAESKHSLLKTIEYIKKGVKENTERVDATTVRCCVGRECTVESLA